VLAAAGVRGCETITARSIVANFRAFADLGIRHGGAADWYMGFGGPDGPQPRPAGRGDGAGRGLRRAGPDREIIDVMLEDDGRVVAGSADATWRRTEDIQGREGSCDTREELKARALATSTVAAARASTGRRVASLDPRA